MKRLNNLQDAKPLAIARAISLHVVFTLSLIEGMVLNISLGRLNPQMHCSIFTLDFLNWGAVDIFGLANYLRMVLCL